jgi:hypothetical protein
MRLQPHWTTKGMTLQEARKTAAGLASVHAQGPRGQETLSPALGLDSRSRAGFVRRWSPTARGCCSSPEPGAHWPTPAR